MPVFRISVSRKLLWLALFNVLAFVDMVVIVGNAFQRVERLSTEVAGGQMLGVIDNAAVGRELVSLFADIDRLSRRCEGSAPLPDFGLAARIQRLANQVSDSALRTGLGGLAGASSSLERECNLIHGLIGQLLARYRLLLSELDQLDQLIGRALIEQTLAGKGTEHLDQLMSLVSGLGETLLVIGRQFAEQHAEHATTDSLTPPLLSLIDDLALRLQTLSAAATEIARSGERIGQLLAGYRELVTSHDQAMVRLREILQASQAAKTQILAGMQRLDQEAVRRAGLMGDEIGRIVASSRDHVLWLSSLVALLTMALVVWLIRANINQPLRQILGQIQAIRQGRPADLGPAREDEWGAIQKALADTAVELARSNAQLQASQERLDQALRGADDGLWDWNLETNAVYYSPRWKSMLGYGEGELEDHLDTWAALVDPEQKDEVLRQVADYLEGRAPSLEIEFRMRHKAGCWVDILSRARLARHADGSPCQPRRLVGTHVDITERNHIARELARQRGFLKTLIQTIPDLIWLKDPEGVYLACNPRFERFFGASEAEILDRTDYDFVDPELADFFRAHDQRAIEHGRPSVNEEWISFANDGHRELLETTKTPMFDDRGGLIGVLGIGHDITDHRRIEERLAQSEASFRSLFDSLMEAVYVQDWQGTFLAVNAGAERMYGRPREWFVGKNPLDVAAPGRNNLPALAPALGRVLAGEPQSFEFWGLRADGTPFPKEVHQTLGSWFGQTVVFALATDISLRKQDEDRLRQAASVFEHAREGIMITDAQGSILDVNQSFSRITGFGRDEVLGKTPRLLSSGRHDATFFANLWQALKEQGHWTGELWNRRKSGEVFPEMQTISAVRGEDGAILRYVALFSDITALKEHQNQLEHIAHYDALTSLPNRVLLSDRLHQAMAQAQRHGTLLAIIYLDLDGFKAINDDHGHEAGDRLLTVLAGRMKQALREGDTLSRLGGDEFVAVLLELPDPQSCVPIVSRMLAAAAEPVLIGGLELRVSASLGVTFFPQADDMDADQLLRQADQAMYQAKQSGKNRYHLFDTEHDRSIRGHHESLEHIREALARGEFVLHYQPKVNLRTGQVIGVEALIRWRHAERGQLLPALFLPVIEGHPLALALGEWVIETALVQIEVWRAQGLGLPVSVNIEGFHLQQADFVERLRLLLTRHPAVPPGDLELEVLETSALEDIAQVSRIILACRELGVGFALDDFGTGYSSLTYLKRLPANLLKIDQSFVHDMLDDPEDLAILEGVLGLASTFRRQAIAEGVETLEHGKMLLQMGCELGQGYAIARPMPAEAIRDWVDQWRPDPSWLHRAPISRDDLPILFAAVEQRAWVSALSRYLQGEQITPPPLDGRECRFGQWLAKMGMVRRAGRPDPRRIVALHEAIHTLAADLVELRRQGRAEQAASGMAEIAALRDELLGLLQQLIV